VGGLAAIRAGPAPEPGPRFWAWGNPGRGHPPPGPGDALFCPRLGTPPAHKAVGTPHDRLRVLVGAGYLRGGQGRTR